MKIFKIIAFAGLTILSVQSLQGMAYQQLATRAALLEHGRTVAGYAADFVIDKTENISFAVCNKYTHPAIRFLLYLTRNQCLNRIAADAHYKWRPAAYKAALEVIFSYLQQKALHKIALKNKYLAFAASVGTDLVSGALIEALMNYLNPPAQTHDIAHSS